jgi:hypothetical protein
VKEGEWRVRRQALEEVIRASVAQEREARRCELSGKRKRELDGYWRRLAEKMNREGRLRSE